MRNTVMRACRRGGPVIVGLLLLAACQATPTPTPSPGKTTIRVATFNIAMGLERRGELSRRLENPEDPGLQQVAAILQAVRPDIVLLNEFDFTQQASALPLQLNFLDHGQFGQQPIRYHHSYAAEVNTGEDSGLDLDGDGQTGGPGDAWGFGRFPGQYGMLLLSRWPIEVAGIRTFRRLPWAALPGATLPVNPDSAEAWYPPETMAKLRLSSKSHWVVPIEVDGQVLRIIALHPTPPVFDGPEDRNGLRNADEIRLAAELAGAVAGGQAPDWLMDDQARPWPQAPGAFVLLGDLNADPSDGDSRPGALAPLLDSTLVNSSCQPASEGAVQASQQQGGINKDHQGPPSQDTADFDDRRVGNLKLDYALPSSGLEVSGCGVFWPASGDTGSNWVGVSDHRLVWVDITLPR